MAAKRYKGCILAAKIALAVVLLGWVLSKANWYDYVIAEDGTTYAVLDENPNPARPDDIKVGKGMLWWRTSQTRPRSDFRSEHGLVVRPGFFTSLRDVNIPLLICAAFGFVISYLIVACRWWYLLRIQAIRISLWESVRLTFLGLFCNQVIPGIVGGDLVKAYYVAKHTDRKGAVMVSIFVDRIMGLAELTLLAAGMIAVIWVGGLEDSAKLRNPAISVGIVLIVVIVAMVFLLSRRFRRALHLQKLYQRLPIAHHIAAAGNAARLYRRRLGGLGGALAVTLGAHVFWIGAIAMLGASLHLPIPWYAYFVFIPLIYIIGAIPISVGGIGWIEGLYLYYFAVAGPNLVLALAILARLIPIFWSLPGIMVAITGPKLPKSDEMRAELGIDESSGS